VVAEVRLVLIQNLLEVDAQRRGDAGTVREGEKCSASIRLWGILGSNSHYASGKHSQNSNLLFRFHLQTPDRENGK
jgi:hypothetical protein